MPEAHGLRAVRRRHRGGGCEVDAALPCPFVDAPTVRWAGTGATAAPADEPPGFAAAQRTRARQTTRRAQPTAPRPRGPASPAAGGRWVRLPWPVSPLVLADLPTAPLYRSALLRSADLLADGVDAVLVGDHPGARVQFPPSYRALLLRDRGVAVWAGLNCRDRNRVALEGELAALADAGAAAVHCVTGDHTAVGHRPDAAPVFDLDATRLAAAARAAGCWCRWRSRRARRPPTDARPGSPRRCGRERRCAS